MQKEVKTEMTKVSYDAPKLTTYGGMKELTASGSKPGNENQGNVSGNDSNQQMP